MPEVATIEDPDGIQLSIDRARSTAQRTFHRSLAELRRVQTERVYRAMALPGSPDPEILGHADSRRLDAPALLVKQAAAEDALLRQALQSDHKALIAAAKTDFAKQTQFRPSVAASVPRNAPCPCGSREKYKRCCGRNAPPVLSNPVHGSVCFS